MTLPLTTKWLVFGGVLIVVSAIIMGTGEGKIVALKYGYTLKKVLPGIALYLIGAVIYISGSLIMAKYMGAILAVWEFTAVASYTISYIRDVTKMGAKIQITLPIVLCVVGIILALWGVASLGNKLVGYIDQQATAQGIYLEE